MKQIHLNAFEMNCLSHLSHGLWAHPDDKRQHYKDMEYWIELAQLLEKGRFDALFLADVLGIYDIYGQSKDPAIRTGMQIPANDPMLVIPLMAYVTKHLGFAVTASTTYEAPFAFSRRMSTLDHLTKGRIAWNVVTSTLRSAAENHGLDGLINHDDRYEIADEFLEVCYKLWEGSWEDEAVIRDREREIYADPDKVHYIHHEGPHYKVPGPHLSEPSPQRTPVIYQAGTSTRGRAFAARHAECVFIGGNVPAVIRSHVESIRSQAEAFGRNPDHIKMFAVLTVIVAETEEEAVHKFENYSSYYLPEGAALHYSAGSGYDLAAYGPDEYLEYVATNHGQTTAAQFTKDAPRKQTVGEIMDTLGQIGARGFVAVGTPETVVDRMQQWIEETGLDGFNVTQVVTPGTLRDFVELVVPELQRRGLFRTEYEEATVRERMFGEGARLGPGHPGFEFRTAK